MPSRSLVWLEIVLPSKILHFSRGSETTSNLSLLLLWWIVVHDGMECRFPGQNHTNFLPGTKKARQMSGEIRLAKNDQQPNVSRWRPRAKLRVNSPLLKWTKRTTATTMMMNVDYQVDICLRRIATISHHPRQNRNMRNNVCVDKTMSTNVIYDTSQASWWREF